MMVAALLLFTLVFSPGCSNNEARQVKTAHLQIQCNGASDYNTEDVHLDEDGTCITEISFSLDNGQWVWFCLDEVQAKTYLLSGGNYGIVRMDMFSVNELYSDGGSITLSSLDKQKGTYDAQFSFTASDPATCNVATFEGTASIMDDN